MHLLIIESATVPVHTGTNTTDSYCIQLCSHDIARTESTSMSSHVPDINRPCWWQEASAVDVIICSLTLFFFFYFLLTVVYELEAVSGHEVIHSSSQLEAVSKVRLFLSANEHRLGRGQQLSGNQTFQHVTAGLCYCVGLKTKRKRRAK